MEKHSQKAKPKKSTPTLPFKLRGIGKQTAEHLARLDILSIQDLLLHLPSRYQDRTRLTPFAQLMPGVEALIEGVITQVSFPLGGRSKLVCELSDGKRSITLRFFHVFPFQKDVLKIGKRLRCFGEVRLMQKGKEMFHPEFQVLGETPLAIEQALTPIYPTTEGLSQYRLRKLTQEALLWLQQEKNFPELLPSALCDALALPPAKEAMHFLHRPPSDISLEQLAANQTPAQKRLIFEELLAHRLSLLQLKKSFQAKKSFLLTHQEKLTTLFLNNLPFALTIAQQRVIAEIKADLAKSYPMLRLVQGDVGSGKTVVAAAAMLQAVQEGYQAVLMAPTELLAEQHYKAFKQWFKPLEIEVGFLTGSIKGRQRTEILKAIASGEIKVMIGTHALFQEEVDYKQLALIVVDEQHRFGVHERATLRKKGHTDGFYPHQLVMTATPIPRTLAMSFYADLDASIIDELPPGRTPVSTVVIANTRREEVIAHIRQACAQGRQVYWVCPLIDESEVLSCQAATNTALLLREELSDLRIGLIHGRLSSSEKESVMNAFKKGETHLLVATTVIEVGVDVPNASVMIIENAERLGLSQLHQLRGRVGRGSTASHCVLLYQSPLSFLAKERLMVMRETTDGFKIAQRDLELRGPGEVLGTRQTGELSFRVADLMRDSELLPSVQKAADTLMQTYPDYIAPLIDRWVGDDREYGEV